MNPRVPIPVVAALIEDADGYLLLGRRPPTKALPMKWEFPGGKVEAGETPLEAYRLAAEALNGSRSFELDGVTGRLRVDPALAGRVERLPSLAVFADGKVERRDGFR